MILTAFEGKFHETKNEIPPRACRPSKKLKQQNVEKVDPQQVKQKNNVDKEGSPPVRPPARAGGPRGAAPREVEKEGIYYYIIYSYI